MYMYVKKYQLFDHRDFDAVQEINDQYLKGV